MSKHAEARRTPREILLSDHQRLGVRLERLVACVRADDIGAAQRAWRAVESGLLAHFDAEEMYVLPAFERVNAAEVAELRAQHADIRKQLGDIGLAMELHTVRAATIDAFAAALAAHAQREEKLAYAWADTQLPEGTTASILRRLGLRSASRRAAPSPAAAGRG